jgi:hypothetical protein
MNAHMVRGNWTRTYDGEKFRHYWHGARVPWILWSLFSCLGRGGRGR